MRQFAYLNPTLATTNVLAVTRTNFRFTVDTDASNIQIESVLWEDQPYGTPMCPMDYWFRTFKELERNYDAMHREWLEVVWPILKLRLYQEVAHFTIRNDHDVLRYIFNLLDSTGQQEQCRLRISEFEMDIFHCLKIKNRASDALFCTWTNGLDTSTLDEEVPTIFTILSSIESDTSYQ